MSEKKHNVIVFTTPSCPWCIRVKNYLRQNNIKFREINVASNQLALKDMIRKSGQQGVPQLWIDGRPIVGFNKPAIDKALGL